MKTDEEEKIEAEIEKEKVLEVEREAWIASKEAVQKEIDSLKTSFDGMVEAVESHEPLDFKKEPDNRDAQITELEDQVKNLVRLGDYDTAAISVSNEKLAAAQDTIDAFSGYIAQDEKISDYKTEVIREIIRERVVLKDALESIACLEKKEQETPEYWDKLSKEEIIATVVNDTKIARKALKEFYDRTSKYDKLSDSRKVDKPD